MTHLSLCPKLELSTKYCAVADAANRQRESIKYMMLKGLQAGPGSNARSKRRSDIQMKDLVVQFHYMQIPPVEQVGKRSVVIIFYFAPPRDESTLFTMLAAVKPITIAIMLIRTSLAIETAEGDNSTVCLTSHVVKATACLTATSERSIVQKLQLSSGDVFETGQ